MKIAISHTADGMVMIQEVVDADPSSTVMAIVIAYLVALYGAPASDETWIGATEQAAFIITLKAPHLEEPFLISGKVYIDRTPLTGAPIDAIINT
jgi:hypothetical protein